MLFLKNTLNYIMEMNNDIIKFLCLGSFIVAAR